MKVFFLLLFFSLFFSFSFQEFRDRRDADDAIYELDGRDLLGTR